MGHNHACPTLSLPVPDRANGSGARVCGPQALWPKALWPKAVWPKAVWPKRPSRPRAAMIKPLLFDRGDTDVTRLPAHECRNGQPHATTPGPECRTPQADAIVAATPIATLGLVRGWSWGRFPRRQASWVLPLHKAARKAPDGRGQARRTEARDAAG
jgi:hypothetical protein